jgi:hypothetical protein
LFENRGNDEFSVRSGQIPGKNRKPTWRLTKIFDAEDGRFWAKDNVFGFSSKS